jgi:pimeloyl-ACP methyl ester carboxylesterase
LGGGLWVFGPREPVVVNVMFDPARLAGGVEAFVATTEGVFDDIRAGDGKQVVRALGPERKTRYAVVYLHGFSASPAEIRPVPDQVARALGANLFLTRFAGHGRDGGAMAGASVGDWMYDAAEALEIGRTLGEEVIVIATSTGGTIAAVAALDAEMSKDVAGIVFVSPNFGVNNSAAPLLTWPGARVWLPVLLGEERSFAPASAGQAAHWSTSYPSEAVFPMAAIVEYATNQDFSGVKTPALFYFSDNDAVVRPKLTRAVAARWGGPVTLEEVAPGAGIDDNNHVIAGDIMSPGGTDPAVNAILGWIGGL